MLRNTSNTLACGGTSFNGISAPHTEISSPTCNAMPHWPSTDNVASQSAGPTSVIPIGPSAAVTTGRCVSECGQIGVMTSVFVPASTMGPPAARLYAVDPIGVDTMINQARMNKVGRESGDKTFRPVYNIYVAVGQKQSNIARVIAELEKAGAMEDTIVVAAGAVVIKDIPPYTIAAGVPARPIKPRD